MKRMVRIVWERECASGRRTSWAKTVDAILANAEKGAKRFRGTYLSSGEETELLEGTLVLEVAPTGSVKNGSEEARLYRVDACAGLKRIAHGEGYLAWRNRFLTVLDLVRAELKKDREAREEEARLEGTPAPEWIDLSGVPLEALRAEIHRREAVQ